MQELLFILLGKAPALHLHPSVALTPQVPASNPLKAALARLAMSDAFGTLNPERT